MNGDRLSGGRTSVVTVVASLVLLAAVVGATATTGVASSASSNSASPHDNGIGANYTVSIPNQESRQPGATGADIRHFAASGGLFEKTSSPDGFKRFDTLTIRSQDIVFGSCSTENTRAFGIDRGNNDSGTTTDEGLLQHRKDSSFNEHSIYVNFYGEGAIAGSPVSLYDEDEIVAAQNGCYQMPDEPGWYQISGRVNGTGFNGNYIDSKEQGTLRSHYFYICDCASEQEAREKLGPPPSEDDGSSDGGSGSDGGSSESTPTATPTASSGDDGGSTPTATSSGSGDSESTPTATSASDGGSGGSTPTATSSGKDGASTSTATSGGATTTASGTATGSDTTGSTATSGGNATGGTGATGGTASSGGNASGSGTPTAGAGPGFGLAAGLLALTGAALLARRRTE